MVYSDQKSYHSPAKVGFSDDNQTKTQSNYDKMTPKLKPKVTFLKQAVLEHFFVPVCSTVDLCYAHDLSIKLLSLIVSAVRWFTFTTMNVNTVLRGLVTGKSADKYNGFSMGISSFT